MSLLQFGPLSRLKVEILASSNRTENCTLRRHYGAATLMGGVDVSPRRHGCSDIILLDFLGIVQALPWESASDRHCVFHSYLASSGPTEALNNLIKRMGSGHCNFAEYRIRILLYPGKPRLSPNGRMLGSIVIR